VPKLHKVKEFEPMAVPNTIVKFKPTFFGTKKDYHDPDCQITVKLAVWVVRKEIPKQRRYGAKTIGTQYVQAVVVDFENRQLLHKGEELTACNIEDVFEILEEMLRG
jgi:hypothetical protein